MINLFGYVMDIGEQMLIAGAEVHRVEESIRRMCYALGVARVDVFIITSSMVVTIHTEDGNTYTQTRRIVATNFDFERLHALNDLSRKICENKLSEQEIKASLNAASKNKKVPIWWEIVAYSVIAGSFTLFFGGSVNEAVISLFVGAVVRLSIFFFDKIISNKIFSKFVSTIIAAILSFLTVGAGWITSVDKIMIGNIMTLIPGIGLTNAIRDLFTGDSIAGLLRTIEAFLTALAIAAGYFLVAFLGGSVV